MNRSRHDFPGPGPADAARSDEPIAIVGASCRLPGAPDLEAFWSLLVEGRDAVTEIPDDRWNKAALLHPEKGQRGKAYTFAAGTIGDVKGFDAGFFGISPREAAQMDPQQRLALELAHEAIEDAGIDVARLAGRSVGVFVGASSWDYLNLHLDDLPVIDAYSMIGITLCSIANRVSYAFDLHGPSFTVDTACSSSLVALHQACEAIRLGQVPMALVGGVSLLLAPQSFVGFCAASMLSPRGRCHSFDARADGYVRAEGGGFVALKPLSAAIADGDPVRAIVRGTGVNSDGRTAGLSLPNRDAQAALLGEVYARFGLDARDLDYLEAHGTGTPAGDPIECAALGTALARGRGEPLPIGSVKTNVGHLEAGSGMAGLLKAMLVAEHGLIPPTLHLETPNPDIDFAGLNLAPVVAPTPFGPRAGARLVGVNSFGFGGTNAHAVIERGGRAEEETETADALPPLLLSARSEGALRALAGTWRALLDRAEPGRLPALLRGQALRRELHPYRLAVPAGDRTAIAAALDAFAEGRPGGYARGTAARGRVGFVFSGNGSQWAGMAADALAGSAAFRAGLAQVDAALAPHLGWSAVEALADPDAARLRDTAVAQPLLFAVQVALVLALREAGIEADAHTGHSVGEVAAAWAAGALDLHQAARVICARSRAQQQRHGEGAMAVLGLGAAEAAAALATPPLAGLGLSVAAHNSRSAATVAGPAPAIDALGEEARARGWRFTRLDLDYAFHNAIMDPIAPALAADLVGLAPEATETPLFSTVTGGELDGQALDADYWWRNIREPVLFAEAATAMAAAGVATFVEIGPHPVLQAYLADALAAADRAGQVVPGLARRPVRGDPVALLAARAHVAGADMRGHPALAGPQAIAGLPRYPWQREPYWVPRTAEATDRTALPFAHPLLGADVSGDAREWRRHVDLATHPWIADHVVGGAAVVPAAALIDACLAAARARHAGAAAIEVADLEIGRALTLEAGVARELRTRIEGEDGRVSIASRARLSDEPWTTHVTARLVDAGTTEAPAAPAAAAPTGRIGHDALYATAAALGLDYGPAFRAVEEVALFGGDAAVVRLRDGGLGAGHLLPPDLVDGALQGLLALAAERLGRDAGVVPWRFGRVRLYRPTGAAPAVARLRVTRVGPRSVRADILLLDRAGTVVAELADCWFVRVALGRRAGVAEGFYHQRMVPAARADLAPPPAEPSPGTDAAPAEAALLIDACASAAAAEALLALAPDGRIDPAALVAAGQVAPSARPLLARAIAWLVEDGLAEPADDGCAILVDELTPSAAILRTLVFDAPAGIAAATLLALAADALPAMLAQGPDASPALPTALREQLLTTTPAIDALVAAIATVARDWPRDRPFRLLEVGARRGELSRRLARAIDHPGFHLVAATGADDLPTLADRLASAPRARAIVWDGEGRVGDERFDLVTGLFAATLDGVGTTPLAAALVPGGRLLLAEPAPNRLWSLLGLATPLDPATRADRLAAGGIADVAIADVGGGDWPAVLLTGRGRPAAATSSRLVTVALRGDPDALPGLADALGAAGATIVADEDEADALVVPLSDDPARLPATLATVAALAALAPRDAPRPVTLIVRGEPAGDTVAAAITGARRVLANEAAHLATRLVRLAPGLPDAAARAAAEIAMPDAEQEVCWSAAGRLAPRLERGLPTPAADGAGVTRLTVARPGLLGSLGWEAVNARDPGAGELAIDVAASGLNFRDVMWAMGLLPDEALIDGFAGATLGLECAGVVAAVGDGVTGFAVGDRVAAFAPAALASRAVTAAHAVMRVPAGMDLASAATLPVAFLTVAYALGECARLGAGETVLIHGGAGGVGLAAIQYARHLGATVIATAGSPAKRALLAALGVDHVLDSRSLAFADEVMRLTGGLGVDVVLNSLSGEAMRRSLGLLKPFGRFLELGKRDFYEDSTVGLRPFRHNVTYFAIDADQLPVRRPALAARLFEELDALFAAGALRPLPYRAFDRIDAEDAFRLMQGSGHVGKIVLVPGAVPPRIAAAAPPAPLATELVHLVTGGLGGFGLETARWLADRGVRRLALVGRRGAATPGAADALEALADAGVDARAYAADVSDEAALAATLAAVRAAQGPIGGVVHAAVAMDDALLGALDADRFARALAPKLAGADALDRLTRDDPVALFLLFSSVTTALGNPGQGNYVAANAAIEAVAERRRAAGLPALAVQWGPIGDAGYLTRAREVADLLGRQLGSAHLTARDALDGLDALLASGLAVAGAAPIRWGALKGRLPLLASPPYAGLGAGHAEEAPEVDLRALLATATPQEARERATAMLVEEVARIMKLAPERVEPQRPLTELGMDSLMAVELRLAVEQRFGVSVPLLALSEGATLSAMAARILRAIGGEEEADPPREADRLAARIRRFEGEGPGIDAATHAAMAPGLAAAAAATP